MIISLLFLFFFFQAEDGIRDPLVTGVQTCALPIWGRQCGREAGRDALMGDEYGTCEHVSGASARARSPLRRPPEPAPAAGGGGASGEIGRASCRESREGAGRGGWTPHQSRAASATP